jgi:hypothetical protein
MGPMGPMQVMTKCPPDAHKPDFGAVRVTTVHRSVPSKNFVLLWVLGMDIFGFWPGKYTNRSQDNKF